MEERKNVNKMDYPIELDNPSVVKDLINNTETGMYPTVSNDNEEIVVFLTKGKGMDVHFYQTNGWIREDSYDSEGYKECESFIGKHNLYKNKKQ